MDEVGNNITPDDEQDVSVEQKIEIQEPEPSPSGPVVLDPPSDNSIETVTLENAPEEVPTAPEEVPMDQTEPVVQESSTGPPVQVTSPSWRKGI